MTGTDYTYTENGIKTTLQLDNLMMNGDLIKATAVPDNTANFQKILLQQLALDIWKHVANNQLGHRPYITFDSVACTEVDPHKTGSLAKNTLFKNLNISSGITIEGRCYYLLDATPGPKHNTWWGNVAPVGANPALQKRQTRL